MIQFLSPISFLALTALAIPIAIHLLNRKAGKTIKVGSIRFLQASDSYRFRSLKLSEIPLLLIRIALLIMLVLLLAEPIWLSDNPNSDAENGWVLVSPELIKNPLNVEMFQRIDSLVSEGNELRIFAGNFPQFSWADSLTVPNSDENYWSLIREAEAVAHHNSTFWVFAPNRLTSFRGQRPTLHSKVHWYSSSVLSQNRWIDEAKIFSDDSLKISVGFSDSSKTFRHDYFIKVPKKRKILSDNGLPPIEFIPAQSNYNSMVRLIEQDAIPHDNLMEISLDDAFNILILHDGSRKDDAHYIEAGLQVVFDYNHNAGSIQSRLIEDSVAGLDDFNWIIWVSPHPVPQNILAKTKEGISILSDADSEYLAVQSQIIAGDERGITLPRLFRRTLSQGLGVALWQDGFGEPVLEYQKKGNALYLQFHSRFHPSWTELVLHPAFPEMMLGLLEFVKSPFGHEDSSAKKSDRRRIAENQILSKQEASVANVDLVKQSLRFPIWIVAALLFLLERFISERNQYGVGLSKKGL